MASLEEVLDIQKTNNILQTPSKTATTSAAQSSRIASLSANSKTIKNIKTQNTNPTLDIALKNTTSSSNVWAYVTGLDINNNNAVFLLRSDGKTVYHPANPSATQSPLQADVAIKLGAPGSTTTVTIPQVAGGRIYFCRDGQLTFLLNPGKSGAALVEPSATNTADPNYNKFWSFAELTYNTFELFVNISYVDFVSLPVALAVESDSGTVRTVPGFPATALDDVCQKLQEQHASDNAGWDKLIIKAPDGGNLRALSPNAGLGLFPGLFNDYYQPYVDRVWDKYGSDSLSIDTQASYGTVSGQVTTDSSGTRVLKFEGVGAFPQPSAEDIFSCNTGAFGSYPDNRDEMANLSARISAAFNRSTLLINTKQPDGESIDSYYKDSVTNHYSRICHAVSPDGHGYAFPYDDVGPSGAPDQSGALSDPNPRLLTVTLGGGGAASKVKLRQMNSGTHQLLGGRRVRRALEWMSAADEKAALAPAPASAEEQAIDLERGQAKAGAEEEDDDGAAPGRTPVLSRPVRALLPRPVRRAAEDWLARLEERPAGRCVRPALALLVRLVTALLSLSVRAVVSRVSLLLVIVLLYLLMGLFGYKVGSEQQQQEIIRVVVNSTNSTS